MEEFVYVLGNENNPDLVKVGRTSRDPSRRRLGYLRRHGMQGWYLAGSQQCANAQREKTFSVRFRKNRTMPKSLHGPRECYYLSPRIALKELDHHCSPAVIIMTSNIRSAGPEQPFARSKKREQMKHRSGCSNPCRVCPTDANPASRFRTTLLSSGRTLLHYRRNFASTISLFY